MIEFWAVLKLTLYQNTYVKIALAKAIRDFKSILPFKLFKKGNGASQRTQPGGRLLQFSTKNTTRSEAKTKADHWKTYHFQLKHANRKKCIQKMGNLMKTKVEFFLPVTH